MIDIKMDNADRKNKRSGAALAFGIFLAVTTILAICLVVVTSMRSDMRQVKVRYDGQTYERRAEDFEYNDMSYDYKGDVDYGMAYTDNAAMNAMSGAGAPVADAGMLAPESDMAAGLDKGDASEPAYGEKIAYMYRYEAETDDFDGMLDQVMAYVSDAGGYLESSQVDRKEYDGYGDSGSHMVRRGSYTLRVPADKASGIAAILAGESVDGVTYENVWMQDYTDAYTDAMLQLESYKKEYARLEELLTMAQSVSETIEVQDRLTGLNYQIQYTQARLDDIDSDVAYSEIDLTLYEVVYYNAEIRSFKFRMGARISEAFDDFLYGLPDFMFFLLYAFAAGILCVGLVALAGRILIRMLRKHGQDRVIRIVQDVSGDAGKE